MLVQIYVGTKISWYKNILMQKVNNEGQLRWLGPEKGVIGGQKIILILLTIIILLLLLIIIILIITQYHENRFCSRFEWNQEL